MDFGGGERSAFPISCSFSACLVESDLAGAQDQIRAISGGCFGHAGCYISALAPAAKVTRELRPPSWDLESNLGCRLHGWVWRKSTTQRSDVVRAALQKPEQIP